MAELDVRLIHIDVVAIQVRCRRRGQYRGDGQGGRIGGVDLRPVEAGLLRAVARLEPDLAGRVQAVADAAILARDLDLQVGIRQQRRIGKVAFYILLGAEIEHAQFVGGLGAEAHREVGSVCLEVVLVRPRVMPVGVFGGDRIGERDAFVNESVGLALYRLLREIGPRSDVGDAAVMPGGLHH